MEMLTRLLTLASNLAESVQAAAYNAAGMMYIGVGLMVIGMGFSSLGEGFAVGNALAGMARNPEASKTLRSSMILGVSLCETVAIYGLVLCLICLFVTNPANAVA